MLPQDPTWRLDELVDRASAAITQLAIAPADPRAKALPDRRTIRWYQTAGLLERPAYRGRAALYGPRHLLQILAIKSLQAAGMSLAQVQAELLGASDAQLRAAVGAERVDAVFGAVFGAPEAASEPPPADPGGAAPRAIRLEEGLLLVVDSDSNPAWADPDRVEALVARLRRAAREGEGA